MSYKKIPWFERNQKIKSEPWRTVLSIERHGPNFHFTWDDHTEVVPVTLAATRFHELTEKEPYLVRDRSNPGWFIYLRHCYHNRRTPDGTDYERILELSTVPNVGFLRRAVALEGS